MARKSDPEVFDWSHVFRRAKLDYLASDVPHLLAELRRGTVAGVFGMRRCFAFLVYDVAGCTAGIRASADRLVGPLYEGLCTAIDRLRQNNETACEDYVREELQRTRREINTDSRGAIPPPASTNSTRKKKYDHLIAEGRRDDAEKYKSYRTLQKYDGGAFSNIERRIEAVLNKPKDYARQTQSGKPIESPDFPCFKRDPSSGRNPLMTVRGRILLCQTDRALDLADGDAINQRILELVDAGRSAKVIFAMLDVFIPYRDVLARLSTMKARAEQLGYQWPSIRTPDAKQELPADDELPLLSDSRRKITSLGVPFPPGFWDRIAAA